MIDEARALKAALDALPSGQQVRDTCKIIAETGYDEAVIIGVRPALIALARKLLEVAYAAETGNFEDHDFERDTIGGAEWVTTSEIKEVFDEAGDVWPVTVYAARDAESASFVVKRLKG